MAAVRALNELAQPLPVLIAAVHHQRVDAQRHLGRRASIAAITWGTSGLSASCTEQNVRRSACSVRPSGSATRPAFASRSFARFPLRPSTRLRTRLRSCLVPAADRDTGASGCGSRYALRALSSSVTGQAGRSPGCETATPTWLYPRSCRRARGPAGFASLRCVLRISRSRPPATIQYASPANEAMPGSSFHT